MSSDRGGGTNLQNRCIDESAARSKNDSILPLLAISQNVKDSMLLPLKMLLKTDIQKQFLSFCFSLTKTSFAANVTGAAYKQENNLKNIKARLRHVFTNLRHNMKINLF